ncbi:hypothetical protein SAMN05720471_10418 [Fibrobacter sp. UWP2]|nr:hypothetical protein SAMN05720471_10418 [Fibrobacter sp. UWP2]
MTETIIIAITNPMMIGNFEDVSLDFFQIQYSFPIFVMIHNMDKTNAHLQFVAHTLNSISY